MINKSVIKKSVIPLCLMIIALVNTTNSRAEFNVGSKTWSNENNEQVSLASLGERVRVVSLFYTDCPNTCSLTIEKFKHLEAIFEKNELMAEFVLMSLDPENDTPSVLKAYRAERNLLQENWHFLTSNERQVGDIARKLGYQFTQLDDHVFHRMKIFIFNSNNEIVDTVKMGTNIEKLRILNKGR